MTKVPLSLTIYLTLIAKAKRTQQFLKRWTSTLTGPKLMQSLTKTQTTHRRSVVLYNRNHNHRSQKSRGSRATRRRPSGFSRSSGPLVSLFSIDHASLGSSSIEESCLRAKTFLHNRGLPIVIYSSAKMRTNDCSYFTRAFSTRMAAWLVTPSISTLEGSRLSTAV